MKSIVLLILFIIAAPLHAEVKIKKIDFKVKIYNTVIKNKYMKKN